MTRSEKDWKTDPYADCLDLLHALHVEIKDSRGVQSGDVGWYSDPRETPMHRIALALHDAMEVASAVARAGRRVGDAAAIAAERARCRAIVADRIDGGTDAGRHLSDSHLTEMIREIEGGK